MDMEKLDEIFEEWFAPFRHTNYDHFKWPHNVEPVKAAFLEGYMTRVKEESE